MSQDPERRQIATTVGTPIQLAMDVERLEAAEVRILFDEKVRERSTVASDRSEIEVSLTPQNPREYCIELVAEESISEEIEHLQQQDDLEISPPKAHAVWDVNVEPADQPQVGSIWRTITNLLALREIGSIVRNRGSRLLKRLRQSDSSGPVKEEQNVDMTLDDFRKK